MDDPVPIPAPRKSPEQRCYRHRVWMAYCEECKAQHMPKKVSPSG